ncbi:hypothetical protein I7I51_01430 [Histoplasma capsulatum]|uniref:Uncharacterized protein n=1 Tax=Ajellomyces capsulatus TaxID=5037 RepID=A0A8A1MI68_AJECA|nr:hypothetical protein I7I51_01430 [Histoplasma capsulatum]
MAARQPVKDKITPSSRSAGLWQVHFGSRGYLSLYRHQRAAFHVALGRRELTAVARIAAFKSRYCANVCLWVVTSGAPFVESSSGGSLKNDGPCILAVYQPSPLSPNLEFHLQIVSIDRERGINASRKAISNFWNLSHIYLKRGSILVPTVGIT